MGNEVYPVKISSGNTAYFNKEGKMVGYCSEESKTCEPAVDTFSLSGATQEVSPARDEPGRLKNVVLAAAWVGGGLIVLGLGGWTFAGLYYIVTLFANCSGDDVPNPCSENPYPNTSQGNIEITQTNKDGSETKIIDNSGINKVPSNVKLNYSYPLSSVKYDCLGNSEAVVDNPGRYVGIFQFGNDYLMAEMVVKEENGEEKVYASLDKAIASSMPLTFMLLDAKYLGQEKINELNNLKKYHTDTGEPLNLNTWINGDKSNGIENVPLPDSYLTATETLFTGCNIPYASISSSIVIDNETEEEVKVYENETHRYSIFANYSSDCNGVPTSGACKDDKNKDLPDRRFIPVAFIDNQYRLADIGTVKNDQQVDEYIYYNDHAFNQGNVNQKVVFFLLDMESLNQEEVGAPPSLYQTDFESAFDSWVGKTGGIPDDPSKRAELTVLVKDTPPTCDDKGGTPVPGTIEGPYFAGTDDTMKEYDLLDPNQEAAEWRIKNILVCEESQTVPVDSVIADFGIEGIENAVLTQNVDEETGAITTDAIITHNFCFDSVNQIGVTITGSNGKTTTKIIYPPVYKTVEGNIIIDVVNGKDGGDAAYMDNDVTFEATPPDSVPEEYQSNMSYVWDFGDGTPTYYGGSSVTHNYYQSCLKKYAGETKPGEICNSEVPTQYPVDVKGSVNMYVSEEESLTCETISYEIESKEPLTVYVSPYPAPTANLFITKVQEMVRTQNLDGSGSSVSTETPDGTALAEYWLDFGDGNCAYQSAAADVNEKCEWIDLNTVKTKGIFQHSYSKAGVYTTTLKVTDEYGVTSNPFVNYAYVSEE